MYIESEYGPFVNLDFKESTEMRLDLKGTGKITVLANV